MFKPFAALCIVIACLCVVIPGFYPGSFPLLPSKKIELGLDLRGGIHVVLQVDFEQYIDDELQEISQVVKDWLKKEKLGPGKVNVKMGGLELKIPSEASRIASLRNKLTKELGPEFEVKTHPKGNTLLVNHTQEQANFLLKQVVHNSILTLHKRIDSLGTRESVIQPYGYDSILIQLPGNGDYRQVTEVLGRTAKLKFVLLDDNDKNHVPQPSTQLGGNLLVKAGLAYNKFGSPVVSFKFNSEGTRKLAQLTTQNVGKRLAIVLDNKVLTSPVIKEPLLTGSGEINGRFTFKEASDLAMLLTSGALPAPLKMVEERIVDASLGRDSINAGRKSAVAALALVSLFMVLIYKISGLWSFVSLMFNLLLIFACIILMSITLTFPGLAGIILTIGMSVDSSVLIFERVKEELAAGKKRLEAVERGFRSAFGTILDANITTLITAIIMFLISSGPIKGFAITLSIGIVSSMFSTLMVTRLLMRSSWRLKQLL